MYHMTPDSPWDLPGPEIFAPSPQLVDLQREYLQEKDTPPLCPILGQPDTMTALDMTMLTEASGK